VYNDVTIDPSCPAPVFNIIGEPEGFNDPRLSDAPNHNTTGVSADGLIMELADNGGPTKTHALDTSGDNPAIDGGSSRILIDQRGRSVKNQRDIGAFEVREIVAPSHWVSDVGAASQWGTGSGLRFGVGFDLPGDQTIQKEPEFLGFEFDTGPLVTGKIKKTWVGRFGVEARLDLAGRFGLEYGYYVDSGTLDVHYDGLLTYNTTTTDDGKIRLATALDIENGSLYTVSPRVGAYADLVIELQANISAQACVVGCYGASFPFSIDETIPLFSINRQDENSEFDGQIKFGKDDLFGRDPEDEDKEDQLVQDWEDKAELIKNEGDADKMSAQAVLDDPNASAAAKKLAAEKLSQANSDIEFADGLLDAIQHNKTAPQQQLVQEAQRQAEIDLAEAQRELDRATREGDVQKQQAARDKIARATADVDDAKGFQSILDQRSRNRSGKIGGGEIVQFSFGQASDSLLGVEATVGVGIGIDGVANVEKEIGTLALTLPDIQLSDVLPDTTGKLSATTEDFAEGSRQDDKRQLARLSVDVGGMLGAMAGMPAGRYSLSLGPLGLNVTTVSYDIGPQLSVNQAVEVVPYVKSAAFQFDKAVDVSINGVPAGTDVFEVTFTPGDTIEIDSGGEVVTVTPSLYLGNRFTNDIGLDVALEGFFEAFTVGLSLFGKSLLNIGPLLTHETTFGKFDLGPVFDRTFDLETVEQTLEPFVIGGTSQDPLLAVDAVTFTPTEVQDVVDPLVFVAVPLLEPDGTLYTEVQVDLTNNELKSVGVLRDGLRYQPLPSGSEVLLERGVPLDVVAGTTSFRLSGFDAAKLSESSTALLALTFDSPDNPTTLTVTRTSAVPSPILIEDDERVPEDEARPAVINREAVEQANAVAVTSDDAMDVNGDGQRDALSDGIVILRYLSGFRGAALVAGIDLWPGTRTSASEIEEYLGALDVQGRLDADGNSESKALSDGILILRQQFGFVEDVLVDGALGDGSTRVTGDEVAGFVTGKKIAVSQTPIPKRDDDGNVVLDEHGQPVLVQGSGFDIPEVLDRTGGDPLGLKNVNRPADNAVPGSSAWVPLPAAVEDGNWMQYSLPTYGQMIEFTPVLCQGEPVGSTADGSPTSGLIGTPDAEFIDASGELDEEAINEAFSAGERETKALGVQTPLFLDAPDAAAYAFRVENGYSFDWLAIDPLAGDTVLIDPVFDLFLPATEEWIEVDLSQPFDLPDGTTEFQLYSRALPNQVAARSTNRMTLPDGTLSGLQPAVGDFRVPFGFTFAGGTVGQTPLVDLQTVAREPVNEPPAIRGSEGYSMHTFRLVRDGANAVLECDYSCEGEQVRTIRIASATRVEAIGTDFAMDTFVIDTSGGPLHMLPIVFRGDNGTGPFVDDTLVVEGTEVSVDLNKNVTLFGVEAIDLRGPGENSLDVSAAAVFANLGANQIFYVLLDPGQDPHNVDAAHDWVFESEVVRYDEVYGLYSHPYQNNAELENVLVAIYRGAVQAEAEAANCQIIISSPAAPRAMAGETFNFDIVYNTDPLNEQLSGIGFRMHYDSTQVTLDEAATAATLIDAPIANVQVQNDTANFDGDTQTDKFLLVGLSSGATPNFPGEGTLPATLLTAHFTAAADFTGTTINFSESSSASGYAFDSTPVTVTIAVIWQNPRHRCDVTDNGYIEPLDVLILINDINNKGSRDLTTASPPTPTPPPFLDPTGDGSIGPIDVLNVINYINEHGSGPIPPVSGAEGEYDDRIAAYGLEPIAILDGPARTRSFASGTSSIVASTVSPRNQQSAAPASWQPASKTTPKIARLPTVPDKLSDYDLGTSELEEAISAISGEVAPTWESGLRV